jgi:CHAT domain-containing protein/tetratricopeptide (TPR) repeat protein
MICARRFGLVVVFCSGLLHGRAQLTSPITPSHESQGRIQRQEDRVRRGEGLYREGFLLWRQSERLIREGDPAAAIEKLREAASILEQVGTPDSGLARVLLTLGRLQRIHGNHHQALSYLERSLDIFLSLEDRLGESRARQLLGVAYFQIGERSRGIKQLELAVAAARASSGRMFHARLAALGYGYVQLGEYSLATPLLEELRGQAPETLTPTAHWALSAAYFHLGRNEDARSAADLGVQAAQAKGNVHGLASALFWRSRALHKLGRTEQAAADAEAALDLIENLRSRLAPIDFMKVGFTDQFIQHMDAAIEILFDLGRFSRAFEVAELGRARAFVDLLAGRTEGSVDPEIDIDELEFLIPQDEPATAIAFSTPAATLADAIAAAKHLQSTVLTYWFTPDAAYIWVIPPDQPIYGRRQRVPAKRLIELTRRAQARSRLDRDALRELYRHLIEPIRPHLPTPGTRLSIIPHGPAFGVSFAALIDGQGKYFIEEYALHYQPAVGAFHTAAPPESERIETTGYVLAANPTNPPPLPDGTPLPALPGSQRELEKIAQVLRRNDSVSTITGPGLRVDELRKSLSNRAVIHFASHAVIDPVDPLGSFLALSNGERLTARDVYGMSLQADLVLLSACRSASGPISLEGVLGLTRAFFYAGARSVVASVWDVADDPAGDLMAEFHRQYQQTRNKDQALRLAQLRLLNGLRNGQVRARTPAGEIVLPEHPILWAGFVLLWNPS